MSCIGFHKNPINHYNLTRKIGFAQKNRQQLVNSQIHINDRFMSVVIIYQIASSMYVRTSGVVSRRRIGQFAFGIPWNCISCCRAYPFMRWFMPFVEFLYFLPFSIKLVFVKHFHGCFEPYERKKQKIYKFGYSPKLYNLSFTMLSYIRRLHAEENLLNTMTWWVQLSIICMFRHFYENNPFKTNISLNRWG